MITAHINKLTSADGTHGKGKDDGFGVNKLHDVVGVVALFLVGLQLSAFQKNCEPSTTTEDEEKKRVEAWIW